MGIKSNGMLLAAKDEEKLRLLTVDGDIKPGSKVS
jgi:methionyl-tRNA synthetase